MNSNKTTHGVEDQKERESRYKKVVYGQLITFMVSMISFEIDKKVVFGLVKEFCQKNKIEDELFNQIVASMEDSSFDILNKQRNEEILDSSLSNIYEIDVNNFVVDS